MTPYLVIRAGDEAATADIGRRLASVLAPGDLVFLDAPMGVGKTALARGLVHAAVGSKIDVPSPTFGFVQSYDGKPPLLHVDLYRLEVPQEIEELGVLDAEDRAVVIEWPDRAGPFLPPADLVLRGHIETGEGRVWTLAATPEMSARLRTGGIS